MFISIKGLSHLNTTQNSYPEHVDVEFQGVTPIFATPIHVFHFQPLYISLWILNRAGWCHSVLLFIMGTLHLLISTASLTCLVKQSLAVPVTLAVKVPCAPWCSFCWCLNMKDCSLLFLDLSTCSLPLVNRLRAVSPRYKLFLSVGHIWHSTW